MANATITEIREGLAANLRAGGNLDDWQVSAYPLANPTPPMIQILRGDIEYDYAMKRGLDIVTMMIQALVALSSDIGSQVRLDPLVAPTGATSVKALLEADRTLAGKVANLRVTSVLGDRVAASATGGGAILVAEWSVDVYASN